MWVVQFVLFPVAAAVAISLAVAVRRGSRERARIARWLAVLVVDLWLWTVAFSPPAGPVLILAVALIMLHAAAAMDLIASYTGFKVGYHRALGRDVGRYRRVNPRRGYSGYKGD